MDNFEVILTEIREHRKETGEGFKELLQRMSVQETKMELAQKDLDKLKPKVESLEHKELRQSGMLAAAALLFEPVAHFVMGKLGLR